MRTMKVGDDWQDALQKLLEREFLISDSALERGAVYLYAPGFAGTTGLPGWAGTSIAINLGCRAAHRYSFCHDHERVERCVHYS